MRIPSSGGKSTQWRKARPQQVFRDVQSIGVGKWRDEIDDALARSTVCVAVVGPRWANADNLLRLHDEGDMVRHELAGALASEVLTLVPTLVEGADVPTAAELPVILLKNEGRLQPSQDWIEWFDSQLAQLPPDPT